MKDPPRSTSSFFNVFSIFLGICPRQGPPRTMCSVCFKCFLFLLDPLLCGTGTLTIAGVPCCAWLELGASSKQHNRPQGPRNREGMGGPTPGHRSPEPWCSFVCGPVQATTLCFYRVFEAVPHTQDSTQLPTVVRLEAVCLPCCHGVDAGTSVPCHLQSRPKQHD